MKNYLIVLLFCSAFNFAKAQTYFPPLVGSAWQTTDPATLGWCQDSIDVMYDWLESSNSKAFILLKDGKIVLEKYFGTFTVDSFHVWNSAGKTLTAYAVGIAQKEGFLDINDPTSDYLGNAWTSCTPLQEDAITIKNQLTMTSGLNDVVADPYCTLPSCLEFLAAANSRWAYHNGPYTLLDTVIESATGSTLNNWISSRISTKIGMSGFYFPFGYNNVYISKPRTMARFGLLLAQNGYWNGTEVLNDTNYLTEMKTPSQGINESYGYLTWLNGQNSFMYPQTQVVFPGPLCPNAPSDMFSAQGKDGQIINVVNSEGIVLIRMGGAASNSFVNVFYNDTIWQYINRLSCNNSLKETQELLVSLYPNPSNGSFSLATEAELTYTTIEITNLQGQKINYTRNGSDFELINAKSGIYFVTIQSEGKKRIIRVNVVK